MRLSECSSPADTLDTVTLTSGPSEEIRRSGWVKGIYLGQNCRIWVLSWEWGALIDCLQTMRERSSCDFPPVCCNSAQEGCQWHGTGTVISETCRMEGHLCKHEKICRDSGWAHCKGWQWAVWLGLLLGTGTAFTAEVLCPSPFSQDFNRQPVEDKIFTPYFTISCLRPKLSDFGTSMKHLSAALG